MNFRISENDIYDDRDRGGLCSGSDLRGSKMAVSSGEADRASDIGNRKNYQKTVCRRIRQGNASVEGFWCWWL